MGAVVAILLLVLFSPYLLKRRSEARRLVCESRQVHLARAANAYSDLKQAYPGYRVNQFDGAGEGDAAVAAKPIGWIYPLLPLLEPPPGSGIDVPSFQPVYDAYSLSGPAETAGETPAVRIPTVICPATEDPGGPDRPLCSFVANTGMPDADPSAEAPADWPANGALQAAFPPSPYPLDRASLAYVVEHDGAANTLLISENVDSGLWVDYEEPLVGFVWIDNVVDGQPLPGDKLLRINQRRGQGDGSYRFARPSSMHLGGVNAVYCSGRTQFVSDNIDYLVFTQLLTTHAGEVKQPGALTPVADPYRVE